MGVYSQLKPLAFWRYLRLPSMIWFMAYRWVYIMRGPNYRITALSFPSSQACSNVPGIWHRLVFPLQTGSSPVFLRHNFAVPYMRYTTPSPCDSFTVHVNHGGQGFAFTPYSVIFAHLGNNYATKEGGQSSMSINLENIHSGATFLVVLYKKALTSISDCRIIPLYQFRRYV